MNFSVSLIDHTPINAFVWDVWPNHINVVYANEATAKTFGLPLSDVVGTDPSKWLSASDQNFWRNFMEDLEREKLPRSTIWLSQVNGERIWLQCSGAFNGIMGNGASQFSFLCENISKWKFAEEKLEELMTVKELEIVEKLKIEFVLSLSHEIRTPMNGILGLTNMLLDQRLEPEPKEYLQMIKRSSENLLRVINDTLDLTKLDIRKIRIHEGEFDLEEALESATELTFSLAIEKGLTLGFFVESDVPSRLRGDSVRLIQTLVNLIDNSLKRTTKGSVAVRVRRTFHPATPNYKTHPVPTGPDDVILEFSIENTGSGPLLEQAYLPQSFFQSLNSVGDDEIGLALCKKFIEMAGGRMWADITDSGVSRLCFTSRYCVTGEPTVAGSVPLITQTKTGLVIADNELSRAAICQHLTRLGMQSNVVSAENAVKALHTHQYHVLIIDLVPDALQKLLSTVRQDEAFANIPKVVITSPQQPKDTSLLSVSFVSQPISRRKLMLSITPQEKCLSPANKPRYDGLHVLVAEDNVINQKIVLKQLQKMGFKVKIANDGFEAVKAVEETPAFALILMDLHMPRMNGLKACEEIRRLGGDRRIPIIALTASAFPNIEKQCSDVGMDGFLTKPFNHSSFVNIIENLIGVPFPKAHTQKDLSGLPLL